MPREHGRKIPDDGSPTVAGVGRRVDLAAGGAEVHAARLERVDGHRVPQHVDVAVALRQALRERFPLGPPGWAAVHAELPVGHVMLSVALDGDNVDGLRLMSMHVDYKAEV